MNNIKETTLPFVIVGHVDHGKSTLIGRLLYDTKSLPPDKIEEIKAASKGLGRETEFAYLLDHFEEERRQGITIDTTQVFFRTAKREYIIIDAPGHVEFVKNMITGASQAESAVLIIDVNEGIKEQTKRHAYILSLMGLHRIIAAYNKMDLVSFSKERFEEVRRDVCAFLESIDIREVASIPMSAIQGDNIVKRSQAMEWYTGPTLIESLDALQAHETAREKSFIFPVQDIYKIDDKRIVAGRVEAGTVKMGQDVKLLPGGRMTRIASIEKYLKETDEAEAGESIGIITEGDPFINRGDVFCLSGEEPILTSTLSATIFWMSKKQLRTNERISIRCATQETTCKVRSIAKRIDSSTFEIIENNARLLNNLEVGEVVLETKRPLAVKPFGDVKELGRFVFVRDENICAGGIITSVT